MLTLKDERKRETEAKEDQYHRTERSYGKFERSILLPSVIDVDRVKAALLMADGGEIRGSRFPRGRGSLPALSWMAAWLSARLFQMVPEVSSRILFPCGFTPFDLTDSGQGVAQMGDVEVPLCVVVRKVPQRLPLGCGLDRREC